MAKDLLLEIGLEELPARFIDDAEKQLKKKTAAWLEELRISYESVTSFSTPRRLAVLLKGVAEEQTSIEEEVKGPAEKIAKDQEGNWSKAAIGFTRGQGKTVEDIYTKELKGTSYIFVKKEIIGKETVELLPELASIIESLQFPKNMRWAEQSLRYARPIRWIAALFGENTIDFEVARVKTSNYTFGHRFLGNRITLTEPVQYTEALKKEYVIADPAEREEMIVLGIKQLEEEEGFRVPVDEELLNEVRNLVEYPTVFAGEFDQSFLQLPSDVLITSMKEHQRYFPVKSQEGELLAHFVGVRNGDAKSIETVTKGNEKVLRARLADAQFFFEEDQKHTIDYYLEKLERIVFQKHLGTISDKVERIKSIANRLAQKLDVDEETNGLVNRAAEICKFDLPTNMVNEFTELQGVIGETYAKQFGEAETAAKAVAEHYMPVQADGSLPQTRVGAIISIADKLDTITGCITVGLIPTGSQDPYGLRRQAAGILKILREFEWDIMLESILGLTEGMYQHLTEDKSTETMAEIEQFFKLRATYLLKEADVEQDVISSVLHEKIGVISYATAKAKVLSEERNNPDFKPVQEALVRVLNLAKKADDRTQVDIDLFETPSEKALYEAYLEVKDPYYAANEKRQAGTALNQLGKLAEPIHTFFENNMVMADDESVKRNRLALINSIAHLINDFADLSLVEWKQHF
ncbi:glycine--tRNA ligase subunit beta [Virgibacillus kekensis]|uniref:Glycine--tRNA ligase beta subunit n=1 Tax=Virgibacillus kekensis TaxID=202261 RepID=A0ABV9DLZ2_9BACI